MSIITHRTASAQAWRRLRKTMTNAELAAVAHDIARVVEAENSRDASQIEESIAYALAAFPWEEKRQG